LLRPHYTKGMKHPKQNDRRLTGSGLPAGKLKIEIPSVNKPPNFLIKMVKWCSVDVTRRFSSMPTRSRSTVRDEGTGAHFTCPGQKCTNRRKIIQNSR